MVSKFGEGGAANIPLAKLFELVGIQTLGEFLE